MKISKEKFFSIETNKKGLQELRKLSYELEQKGEPTWLFFNEVSARISEYLGCRKAIKKIVDKPTTQGIYESYVNLKQHGYRKNLVMPFWRSQKNVVDIKFLG